MTSALRVPRRITPEEYLMIERRALQKSELIDGVIYAITPPGYPGASLEHITINNNLTIVVGNQLKGSGCRGLGSDMRVRTPATETFTYPDLTIVCGRAKLYDTEQDTLENPIVIFEILSPSTESYDRNEKFTQYKEIDTLLEYVLISQHDPRIEHFVRQEDGSWLPTIVVGLGASLTLSSIPVTLPLSEVYDTVEFDAAEH